MPEKQPDHTSRKEDPLFTKPEEETLADLTREARRAAFFFSSETRAGVAEPENPEDPDIYAALEREVTEEE